MSWRPGQSEAAPALLPGEFKFKHTLTQWHRGNEGVAPEEPPIQGVQRPCAEVLCTRQLFIYTSRISVYDDPPLDDRDGVGSP